MNCFDCGIIGCEYDNPFGQCYMETKKPAKSGWIEKAKQRQQVNELIDKWAEEGFDKLSLLMGYHLAEKDLALTIEDIELLHTFLYAIKNNKHGCFTFTRLSDEQYEEVLRRFRETKDK